MDPSNSLRLWIGGRRLWRTDNGAASWNVASDGTIFTTDQALSADGVTPWESSRARAGGYVSSFAFHPEDADVVYAVYTTFGGSHVFRNDRGGAAPWRRLDGVGWQGQAGRSVAGATVVAPSR